MSGEVPHSIAAFGPVGVPCEVDIPRALRYLGHRRQEVPADLEERLLRAAKRCRQTARPRAMGRTFAIASQSDLSACPGAGADNLVGVSAVRGRDEGRANAAPGPIRLEGAALSLPGADIARFLAGCTHAVLLVVTLGMENERALRQAAAAGPVEALLADACSSSLAEEAACAASDLIDGLAREAELFPTKRFSPGYGDLPLALQPEFLKLVGADAHLGVHAGPSFLMTPMKSITAVVGLRPLRSEER